MTGSRETRHLSTQLAALIVLLLLFALVVSGGGGVSGAVGSPGGARPSAAPSRTLAVLTERGAEVADHAPGRVAFALVLPGGTVVGERLDMTFASASLSKSLLAVALLRSPGLVQDAGALADGERMVRWSDNAAATRTLHRLGLPAVRAAATAAGMRDFSIGAHWSESRASARDFARLLLVAPDLVPSRQRERLRRWFVTVTPTQSWGIPEVLRPRGARVLFKGGWRGGLVHQAARVEFRGRTYGFAVLSDRQPAGLRSAVPTITRIASTMLGATRAQAHQRP